MSWFTDKHTFLLAVIGYGLSTVYSVFLWRKGFRDANRVNYVLLALAFVCHTMAMLKRGFSLSHCPVNNLYEAITFVAWTIVASYLLLGLVSRLRFLGAFASPVLFAMGVFALMPALDPPTMGKPNFATNWKSIHAALILLSFGAFGLSSVSGVMYLVQEHDLKFHKLRAIFSKMPPIQRLDSVIARALLVGFVLLTAGLFVSFYHQFSLPNSPNIFSDPLLLWSIFVWVLYLTILILRGRVAQGGRRFAWGAVGSFAFVLLTFWGFYLLSGIHQN